MLTGEEVTNVLANARKTIVCHMPFREATARFRDGCQIGGKARSLSQDMVTRWSLTMDSLNRFMEIKQNTTIEYVMDKIPSYDLVVLESI